MKRAQFTEDQIAGVLKEHEAPGEDGGSGAQARRLGSYALQLEGQELRHGCLRGQTAEAARGRERQTEEAFGRADVGCRRTRRWAISHRQPMPPISPQHATVCATPTCAADRILLHHAQRRKNRRGSNRPWMKVQWRVSSRRRPSFRFTFAASGSATRGPSRTWRARSSSGRLPYQRTPEIGPSTSCCQSPHLRAFPCPAALHRPMKSAAHAAQNDRPPSASPSPGSFPSTGPFAS